MALVITNGDYFLAQGTKVRKTKNSEEIKVFDRVCDASDSIKRTPGLLKGYYVYDTITKKVCWEQRKHHKAYPKRKNIQALSGRLSIIMQADVVNYVVVRYYLMI